MYRTIFLSYMALFISSHSFSQDAVFKFKLAENQPPNNPVTLSMEMFSKLVHEKSSGTIQIDVFPSAQLGQETENIEQLQAGLLDFARVNTVTLSQVVNEVGVFALPYIFENYDHKYRVLDGELGSTVSGSFESFGFTNLGYLESGTRNFYVTKDDVKSIDDLKGLKIRVQPSNIPTKMVAAIGAVPTPMNYGEVYSALQTGVIDGAENDFTSLYTSSHYEVAKVVLRDEHLSAPAVLLVSNQVMKKLNDEQKSIINEAAAEAISWQRKAMVEFNDNSEKKVIEAGVKIIEVDKKPYQDAVQSIYDEFPNYKEIIVKIKELEN